MYPYTKTPLFAVLLPFLLERGRGEEIDKGMFDLKSLF
jgi:hypothetical protein